MTEAMKITKKEKKKQMLETTEIIIIIIICPGSNRSSSSAHRPGITLRKTLMLCPDRKPDELKSKAQLIGCGGHTDYRT